MSVHADVTSRAVSASSASEWLAQSSAAAFAVCAFAVVSAGAEAGSVDAHSAVTFFVEDAALSGGDAASVDAVLARCAVSTLRALRCCGVDTFEVTALLTVCAWVVRVALSFVWSLADVVHAALAECTVSGADTLKLRAWVTGALAEVRQDREALCGRAILLADADALEASWAFVVVFTGTGADAFASA